MHKISAKKIVEIVGSSSEVVDTEIFNITTDSRNIKKGDLFVAIKGEKFDGHLFVKEALEKGAEIALVQDLCLNAPRNRQILVADTLEAYGKLGLYNREQFQGVVIALTGSAGKTTTKEELKHMLSNFGKTYATSGNFNNLIGVPKTLLEIDMDADYAIIEMGMSEKGEISKLTSYAKPDIAIITNVYPMHIEFFESFEGIAHAKSEIFEGLKKNGVAIINADTNFANILETSALNSGAKVMKFGKNHHSLVEMNLEEEAEHFFYNAWTCLRVAEVLGLDLNLAAKSLESFGALEGRGKKWNLNFAKGQYVLIDDSYSGQPEAMRIAIERLSKMPCLGKKIAVLGKMAELGDLSKQKHIEIGQVVAEANVDVVVGIKEEMKDMLNQLPKQIEQYYFENKDGLDEFLLNKLLQNNDIVLIKGARYSSELYKTAKSLIEKGA